MKFLNISENILEKFLKNIRPEDKSELEFVFGYEYKNRFIDICLKNKNDFCLIGIDDDNPVAIGGVNSANKNGLKIGQIWLMCTICHKKYKIASMKVIISKLKNYLNTFDLLFNFVFKTNFNSDVWLKKYGFKFVKTENKNFKFFYNKEGEKYLDLRHITR